MTQPQWLAMNQALVVAERALGLPMEVRERVKEARWYLDHACVIGGRPIQIALAPAEEEVDS